MNIYLKRVVVVIERVKGQNVCCPLLLAFFHVVVRVVMSLILLFGLTCLYSVMKKKNTHWGEAYYCHLS